MTYSERRYNSEMYHFGILGMQWGRRNGPPYPLDSEDHSQREKAAGWRKSLFRWNKRSENRSPSSQEKEERSTKPKKSKLHLTDKQKRYLKIGAAAALTAVAAYAGYKYLQNKNSISTGKEATEKLFGDLGWKEQLELGNSIDQKLDTIDRNFKPEDIAHCTTSRIENLKIINSDMDLDDNIIDHLEKMDTNGLTIDQYKQFGRNWKAGRLMNCTSCTVAGNLRARGYDVVAGKMLYGNAPQAQASWWKNAKVESLCGSVQHSWASGNYNPKFDDDVFDFGDKLRSKKNSAKSIATIKERLLAYGNNSSGSFNAINGRNGGHCVEFLVEDGNVKIFDNQLGRSYGSIESWFEKTGYNPNYSYWLRTDNLEPDLNEMIRQGIIQRRK